MLAKNLALLQLLEDIEKRTTNNVNRIPTHYSIFPVALFRLSWNWTGSNKIEYNIQF